jgi:hypothetical protein
MRTDETHKIERVLGDEFAKVEAYRYNSASIRVRVIDDRFVGKSKIERQRMVDPILETLPEDTQCDIMLCLTLTNDEINDYGMGNPYSLANLEFDDPSPSSL